MTTCSETLHLSYERYIASQSPRTRLQRLFVPGLEPTYTPSPNAIKLEDEGPPYTPWRASDMYFKNGIEVKRKGVCEGTWVDERKWDRVLWSVAPEEEVEVEIDELWRRGKRMRIRDEVKEEADGNGEREDTPGL